MKHIRTSFAVRIGLLGAALILGPAALAPGAADAPGAAPTTAQRASGSPTAATTYEWRAMQWDYAWEFGESLDSPAYRGEDIRGGYWTDYSTGTGRVVKYGGGLEFHSGERDDGTPDRGDVSVTLHDKAATVGRWELRERVRLDEKSDARYAFVVELVPEGTLPGDCGAKTVTIARVDPGGSTVTVGADNGTDKWTKTLAGYARGDGGDRLYAVQITGRRITWFVNGKAVASTDAAAALPKVPLTLRMRLVGGSPAKEMNKTTILIDWVRHYDLSKGTVPPEGASLVKGSSTGC